MGILKKVLGTTLLLTVGATGWTLYTARKLAQSCDVRPLSKDDPLYASAAYKRWNPRGLAVNAQICSQSLPFPRRIKESFDEEGDTTRLADQFSRHFLEHTSLFLSAVNRRNHIKSIEPVEQSYEVLTTSSSGSTITRSGDGPGSLPPHTRDTDSLYETSVVLDELSRVAEFRLKTVTFRGSSTGPAESNLPDMYETALRLAIGTAAAGAIGAKWRKPKDE